MWDLWWTQGQWKRLYSVFCCQYRCKNYPHSLVHDHLCYMISEIESIINNTPINYITNVIYSWSFQRSYQYSILHSGKLHSESWTGNMQGSVPVLIASIILIKKLRKPWRHSGRVTVSGPRIWYGSPKTQNSNRTIRPRRVVTTALPLRVW